MRRGLLIALLLVGAGSPGAWAKTLKIEKGTIAVNQLHDELLATFPQWRGTQRADGTFVEPLLGVESTDQEITLTLPDDADEPAVRAVVAAHTPKPPRKDQAVAARATNPSSMTLEARVKRLEGLLGGK